MQKKSYNPRTFIALENTAREYNREIFVLRDNQIDLIANISLILADIQTSQLDTDILEAKFTFLSSDISEIAGLISRYEVLLTRSIEELEKFFL